MFMTHRISKALIVAAVAAIALPLPVLAQSDQENEQTQSEAALTPAPRATPPTSVITSEGIFRVQPTTRPGQPGVFTLRPAQVEQKMELQTYLGVSTRSLPREVAPHVNVAEGVGLMVSFVEPESPAAEAGIEANDIIIRFDDQWAINMDQFTVLVRMHESGDTVTLTLLRRGEQQEVEVTLGEKELPVGGPSPFGSGNLWHGRSAPAAPGAHGGSIVLPPQMKELEALQESVRAAAGADAREAAEKARRFAEELRSRLDAQRLELELMQPELLVPGADAGGARVTITNGNISARLVNENGTSSLTVEDNDSDYSYEGPFPSDEEIEEMPDNVQELVRQMKRYAATPTPATPRAPMAPERQAAPTRPSEEREQVRA